MKNLHLFRPEELPPQVHYEKLFSNLLCIEEHQSKRGRPPFSKHSLLQALIYKSLRGLPTLSELSFELRNNPAMTEILGFDPLMKPPPKERFSHFLRTTPNEQLQIQRLSLVCHLIEEKVITGGFVALDSCPIKANVKENNLKTSVKTRFDKAHIPKGDPEAKMGVLIHYPQPSKQKIDYFWGYRNHIVTDAETELPINEKTYPANKNEQTVAVPLLEELSSFGLCIKSVLGDANYDTEAILSYIFHEMKASPVIPRNPRNQQKEGFKIKKNNIICPAALQMNRKGKMTVKGITYLQYNCPLHWGKAYQGEYLICPAAHPKYFKQKGCNFLLRLTPSVRAMIDYGSQRFKKQYNLRTAVERVFSRLLAIAMQRPSVIGLQATQNHCTIAHITVLLVALTAHRMGFTDKIRYVKSFLPRYGL
jgi:hypothetical protein